MLFPNMVTSLRSRREDIASHCSRVCRTTEGNTRQCGFPAKFIQRLALDASQMHARASGGPAFPLHLVSRKRHHPRIGNAGAPVGVIGIPRTVVARATDKQTKILISLRCDNEEGERERKKERHIDTTYFRGSLTWVLMDRAVAYPAR